MALSTCPPGSVNVYMSPATNAHLRTHNHLREARRPKPSPDVEPVQLAAMPTSSSKLGRAALASAHVSTTVTCQDQGPVGYQP
jgi:hypothetical protein